MLNERNLYVVLTSCILKVHSDVYRKTPKIKQLTDNKTVWQKMKAFLSDKNKATEKITLVSDDKIFSDDLEIAEKFSEFFKNTVNNLNLSSNEDLLFSTTIYLIQFR